MYFTNTSFLNSIEAMMKCPPGSRQRGGGRNRCPYRYTKKTATAGSASTTEKRTAALWKFVRHWISGFHKYKTERIISPYITSTASKAKPWAMASTVRLGSPPNPKSGGLTGSCRLRPPHGEHKQRKINCQSCPKALETRVEKLLPLWMIRASTAWWWGRPAAARPHSGCTRISNMPVRPGCLSWRWPEGRFSMVPLEQPTLREISAEGSIYSKLSLTLTDRCKQRVDYSKGSRLFAFFHALLRSRTLFLRADISNIA